VIRVRNVKPVYFYEAVAGAKDFSNPQCPGRRWAPPSLLSSGRRGALSPGLKRPRSEGDHSPPYRAEVKNGGAILHSPQVLTACCLLHRGTRTIYLLSTYSTVAPKERSLPYPLGAGTGRVVPFIVGSTVPIFRNQPITLIIFPSEVRYGKAYSHRLILTRNELSVL
jgi:hypothetical protein